MCVSRPLLLLIGCDPQPIRDHQSAKCRIVEVVLSFRCIDKIYVLSVIDIGYQLGKQLIHYLKGNYKNFCYFFGNGICVCNW